MARAGMRTLITRLRRMCEAGTADYSVADETYWPDDMLQEELDNVRTFHIERPLTAVPQFIDNEYRYHVYQLPGDVLWVEGPLSGTANFRISNFGGTAIGTANFTFREQDRQVVFTADQEGSAYYWTGYSYDLNRTASEVWSQKASHSWSAIDFSADAQKFTRSALFKHAEFMATKYRNMRGLQVVSVDRSDMRGVQETFK